MSNVRLNIYQWNNYITPYSQDDYKNIQMWYYGQINAELSINGYIIQKQNKTTI